MNCADIKVGKNISIFDTQFMRPTRDKRLDVFPMSTSLDIVGVVNRTLVPQGALRGLALCIVFGAHFPAPSKGQPPAILVMHT